MKSPNSVSINRRISDLIPDLYSISNPNSDIKDVVDAISAALPFGHVCIHGASRDSKQPFGALSESWSEIPTSEYFKHYHKISPWLRYQAIQPTGKLILPNHSGIDLAKDHPEFFCDWVCRAGIGGGVAVKLFEDSSRFAVISVDYRHDEAERFDDVSTMALNQIFPHLSRALSLRNTLSNSWDGTTSKWLELLEVPAFVIDRRSRIIDMNDLGEAQLRSKQFVFLSAGHELTPISTKPSDAFQRAVRSATSLDVLPGTTDATDVILNSTNEDVGLAVASVRPSPSSWYAPRAGWEVFAPDRHAIVTINEAALRVNIKRSRIASLYALTQAETRIIALLCLGMDVESISEMLGNSVHTVRGHLKRAMQKMGCRKQSEMVALALHVTRY